MKIERYIMLSFADLQRPKDKYRVFIPEGSTFLGLKVMHDGIYAWYAIPEIKSGKDQIEAFTVVMPNTSIPDNTTFIAVLDTLVHVSETEQGTLVFPIFKFNN